MHAPLVSIATLVSLAASTLASSSHYSHGIRALPHHGVELVKARSLGSRGKGGPNRLSRRGQGDEAVLKCTSAKTFELCDGDRCTDMGSVAAGTMCKDGAITWDTTGEASAEDSSSASSSIAEPEPSSSSSPAASVSSASAADVIVPVKQNAVKTLSTSFSSPSLTTPAAAAATSSTSAASGDDEEDWECEAEDVETDDSSSAASTYTTSSAPTTTSVAPQLAVKPKTTTTTQAPSTTSAAPVVSASVSVGTGSGDWITGGKATVSSCLSPCRRKESNALERQFFYQEGGYGACGIIHQDSQFGVALALARYGTSSNNNPECGKTVLIKNNANGKTVEAQVWDACPVSFTFF